MAQDKRDPRLHITAKELQRVLELPPTAETVLEVTSQVAPGEETQPRFVPSMMPDGKTIKISGRVTRTARGVALEELMPAADYADWLKRKEEQKVEAAEREVVERARAHVEATVVAPIVTETLAGSPAPEAHPNYGADQDPDFVDDDHRAPGAKIDPADPSPPNTLSEPDEGVDDLAAPVPTPHPPAPKSKPATKKKRSHR